MQIKLRSLNAAVQNAQNDSTPNIFVISVQNQHTSAFLRCTTGVSVRRIEKSVNEAATPRQMLQ